MVLPSKRRVGSRQPNAGANEDGVMNTIMLFSQRVGAVKSAGSLRVCACLAAMLATSMAISNAQESGRPTGPGRLQHQTQLVFLSGQTDGRERAEYWRDPRGRRIVDYTVTSAPKDVQFAIVRLDDSTLKIAHRAYSRDYSPHSTREGYSRTLVLNIVLSD